MAFPGRLGVFFLSLAKIRILYYIGNQFVIKFYSFYDSPYLRKAASGIIPIPKANPTEVIVNIVDNDTKTPIKGVSIVFSANNGTYLSGVTDDTGYCKIIIWRFRSKGPQKTDDYFGVKPPKKDPIINKKGMELGSRASIFRSIATQFS